MSKYLIQKIFCAHSKYLESTSQSLKNRKAIYALQNCRTEAMGVTYYSCPSEHKPIKQFHSCRHRSCFVCAQKTRIDWIESQRQRLFNIPHFHVVFTLPHEYLPLWRYNESLFTKLIFKASRDTLLELLSDKKYGGIKPGILMALHTWGRKLDLHPHTHCLVTAGGIDKQDQWKTLDDYLLPIRVVKTKYRGKLQTYIRDAFESYELQLPPSLSGQQFWRIYRTTYQKQWSVRIEERYEHGKGVMLYLARYLKGGPINPKQINALAPNKVGFQYLDHRDKRVKDLELTPEEFLKRVLTHVPPSGKHTVRFYGVYATCAKEQHNRLVSELGSLAKTSVKTKPSLTVKDMLLFCPTCGAQAFRTHSRYRSTRKGNSINKEDKPEICANGLVQQRDQTDHAQLESLDSS